MIVAVQLFNEHSHHTEVKSTFSDAIRSFPTAIQASKPIQNHSYKVFRRKWKSETVQENPLMKYFGSQSIRVRNLSHKRLSSKGNTQESAFQIGQESVFPPVWPNGKVGNRWSTRNLNTGMDSED